jgi:FG-GAP repeat protein
MKSKSTSQYTFSNLAILICLLLFLAVPATFAAISSGPRSSKENLPLLMEQKVTASDGMTNSYFGSAVSLTGSTALIGADGDSSFKGAAYLFTKLNGAWSQGQKLTASDGMAGDEFGYRVTLSDATLLIGAFTATVNGNTSQGAAYVFTKSSNTWSQSQKLTANDGGLFDNFGAAVALDGETIVVAANGATVGGNPAQGAVYVFTFSNGTWTQTQKLTANDGAAYDNFGLSVALEGSMILVGSPRAAVGSNAAQGAVYVFTESNGSWTQTQKLAASDGAANDSFGESVAISNSTALVGAYNATVNSHPGQGAAYVFINSNSTWSETQKLTASDGSTNANFGNAVALDSSRALIGADVSTVGNNTSQGKAYLFEQSNGNWSQSYTLVASDGATDDFFGAAVTLDGPTLLVSTPHPTIGGNTYQGAAYFYALRSVPTPRARPTPAPRPTPR